MASPKRPWRLWSFIALALGLGLVGGAVWALRPRSEPETAVLARRELREAVRQMDLFLALYPQAPEAARGALQRAASAFDQAAGHLALNRPAEVSRWRADFQRLQDLAAAGAPPETVLPQARSLREALRRLAQE